MLRPPSYLHVEPSLLARKLSDWIKKADFSKEMFDKCIAVCIRPGLGTISDALVTRSRIFPYAGKNSFEMSHNIKIIEEMNLGFVVHRLLNHKKALSKFLFHL